MTTTRPLWLLLSARPPPRLLSRRLLDQKFIRGSCRPITSSQALLKDEKKVDEDAIHDIFRRRAEGRDQEYEDFDPESLVDDDFKVNIFDQDSAGKIGRRINQTELSLKEEMEFESELAQDELELRDLELPTQMSPEVFHKFFPDEAYQQTQEQVDTILRDSNLLQHHIATDKPIPRQAQLVLERLNSVLDEAFLHGFDEERRKTIWVWYKRCKHEVPDFLRLISASAWTILQNSQSKISDKNPYRLQHQRTLLDDKESAGWPIAPKEQLISIEALYMEGAKSEALEKWRALDKDELSTDPHFLNLGARILALSGRYNDAELALRRTFSADPNVDPRIIMPLIRALCASAKEQDITRAWSWYEELRDRLGARMTMRDYDDISTLLLTKGHHTPALAIFRDMMLSGSTQPIKTLHESTKSTLRLMDKSSDVQQVNEVALTSLRLLPAMYRNKFFFGSWIKKLIGAGELLAASQVVELMYEVGICPDTKYLNGLIGAWLREDTAEDRTKAERLGWMMLGKRVNIVRARKHQPAMDSISLARTEGKEVMKAIPLFVERPVPAGNMETLCILADHYMTTNNHEQVRHLRDLMPEADLPMNSIFMNTVLNTELRLHGHQRAWARFQVMSRKVRPDIETWLFFWQCMVYHLDGATNRSGDNFPMPRDLFQQMMGWFDELPPRDQARAVAGVDLIDYASILRGFSDNRDLNGLLVAMYALHETWGAIPDEKIAQMLIKRIARLDIPTKNKAGPAGVRARRRRTRDADTKNTLPALKLLETVRSQRAQQYAAQGIQIEDLEDHQKGQEAHRTLLAFLFVVLKQREDAHSIMTAAKYMGVPEFDVHMATELVS